MQIDRRIVGFLAASFIVTTAQPLIAKAAPPAPQSYPMTCQLGPANMTVVGNGFAIIRIQHATGPASAGLQAGQCAFEDRGLKTSEPTILQFSATIESAAFNDPQFTGKNSVAFGGPAAAILPSIVFGPTKLVNMFVHQGPDIVGAPCFVVDKFGV